jgi:hypothetical protein
MFNAATQAIPVDRVSSPLARSPPVSRSSTASTTDGRLRISPPQPILLAPEVAYTYAGSSTSRSAGLPPPVGHYAPYDPAAADRFVSSVTSTTGRLEQSAMDYSGRLEHNDAHLDRSAVDYPGQLQRNFAGLERSLHDGPGRFERSMSDYAGRAERGLIDVTGRFERSTSNYADGVSAQISAQVRGVTELLDHEARSPASQGRGLSDQIRGTSEQLQSDARGISERFERAGGLLGQVENMTHRGADQIREDAQHAAKGGLGRMLSAGARRAASLLCGSALEVLESDERSGTIGTTDATGMTLRSKSIKERLLPTRNAAKDERDRYAQKGALGFCNFC